MKISKEDSMKISSEELTALKKILPHGGIKLIAEKTGLSYRMVQHVLSGRYRNQMVISTAMDVIKEDNQRKKEFLKKLLKSIN